MKTLKTLDPRVGDLLRCWLPQDDQPNKPGPKFRPVFFWGTKKVNGQLHFAVSYGTGQVAEEKEARNGGDIFVPAKAGDSLRKKDGRFDFNKIALIPAIDLYFTFDHQGQPFDVSRIPKELLNQVGDAMQRARVTRRLEALGVTVR